MNSKFIYFTDYCYLHDENISHDCLFNVQGESKIFWWNKAHLKKEVTSY